MSDNLINEILFPWTKILSKEHLTDWKNSLNKLNKESLKEFLEIQDISPEFLKNIVVKNYLNIPLNFIRLGELYTVIKFSSFNEQYQADSSPNLGTAAIIYISSVQFYRTNECIGIIRYYMYYSPSEEIPQGTWSSHYTQSSVGQNGHIYLLNNLSPLKDSINNEKVIQLLLKKDKTYVSIQELYQQLSNFQFRVPNKIIYYPLMKIIS